MQSLAYQILPNLPEEMILKQITALEMGQIDRQAEVRKILANTFSILAVNGHADQVLSVLETWSGQDEPDLGTITRCFSKPWVVDYPVQVMDILTRLVARTGPKKRIRLTLESLYRNGAEVEVLAVLENWRESDDPNLRAAGEDQKLVF
jgi:hypothetical protein